MKITKPKIYYGMDAEGKKPVMLATITGQMNNGTYIYTECDSNGNLIDIDVQYTRSINRYGTQLFFRI